MLMTFVVAANARTTNDPVKQMPGITLTNPDFVGMV
jgi:hypothetical protein